MAEAKMGGMKIILGQPSWRLASDRVEAFVTQLGGHLAPVTFDRRGRKIAPYSVAPWAEEKLDRKMPAILRALRGDFFCLPFGGNAAPFRGEKHPMHGETANAKWRLEAEESNGAGRHRLHLSLKTRVRPGGWTRRLRWWTARTRFIAGTPSAAWTARCAWGITPC